MLLSVFAYYLAFGKVPVEFYLQTSEQIYFYVQKVGKKYSLSYSIVYFSIRSLNI
jgi:hypothetical protein